MITRNGNSVTYSFGPVLLAITALLIFLKVCGVGITWMWVFSPLWIPWAIFGAFICLSVACILGFIGIMLGITLYEHFRN